MPSERHREGQRRAVWPPSTGYFSISLIRGGWRVPARIDRDSAGAWFATIDAKAYDPHHDPALAPHVDRVWHSGWIIDQAEYDYLVAVRDHARATGDEHHPALNPLTPIHPMRLRPIIP